MPNIKVSPELALLINASLKKDANLPIDVKSNAVNWELLMKLARWHQVRPLLFDYLNQTEGYDIPDKYFDILKDDTITQAVTNMTFLGISLDLYSQLRAQKIRTFLMKGALWAWMLYEKPGSREFGDIDFFIDEHNVSESLSVLSRNGFEPDAYREFLLKNESVANLYLKSDYQLPLNPVGDNALQSLEIQWNATYPRYCYRFSADELTSRMMDYKILSSSIQVPGFEHQLLMMLVHHAGVEQWDKLKYFADFIRLLRKEAENLDWTYIEKVTAEKGFNRLLKESLGLVKMIIGENYFRFLPDTNQDLYPANQLLNSVVDHWENGRPVRKSKSWRIFVYNVKYRDNIKYKADIIIGHLSYLLQWRLIWPKILWYYKK